MILLLQSLCSHKRIEGCKLALGVWSVDGVFEDVGCVLRVDVNELRGAACRRAGRGDRELVSAKREVEA